MPDSPPPQHQTGEQWFRAQLAASLDSLAAGELAGGWVSGGSIHPPRGSVRSLAVVKA
jgi:hypothetical protein